MHNAAKNALELRKVGAKTRASLFVGPRTARAGAVARRNLRRVTFFLLAQNKSDAKQRWHGLRAKNSGGARARAVIFRAHHMPKWQRLYALEIANHVGPDALLSTWSRGLYADRRMKRSRLWP